MTNGINPIEWTDTRRSQGARRAQPTQDPPQRAEDKKGVNTEPQPLTARMLNEFVYCPPGTLCRVRPCDRSRRAGDCRARSTVHEHRRFVLRHVIGSLKS